MPMRALAAAAILLIGTSVVMAQAGHPTAQCGLNDDRSRLVVTVFNNGNGFFACTAQCRYTESSGPALQTFSCNYALGGGTSEKVACGLDGDGPGHFATVQPTRFVCQPR